MKKLLLSLLLIPFVCVKASEPAQIVSQATEIITEVKPVLIKNAVDKSVEIFNWLATSKAGKFIADNKVTNTFTQDEYVQKAWADKLGKATLIAAPFYLFAFSKMSSRPKQKDYYGTDHSIQIDHGFSALNYAVIGAIVHATTYAYLNK